MKKGMILSLLVVAFLMVKGQDKYHWNSDLSLGYIPISVSGTQDVGSGTKTIVNNITFATNPVYEHKETNGFMLNLLAHFGATIPIYATKTWSTGVSLNTGFGYQKSFKNAEGLSSFVVNFPNYIYYRNNTGSSFDFSVLLGYQYTYTLAALNSHLMLVGFEYHINEEANVRLFGSVFRYKYYNEYTDGRTEPALKIGEFGVAYIVNFS